VSKETAGDARPVARLAWAAAAVGLVLPLMLVAALAQTPPPPGTAAKPAAPTAPAPVPVGKDPSATTAAFGDWILRCVSDAGGRRICEVTQSIVVAGQEAPLAQIALGRVAAKEPLRLTLVVPNNVTLLTQPRVAAGAEDDQPVALAWQRCLPGGCFAGAVVDAKVLTRWRAGTGMGQIAVVEGAGRQIGIPFSFRGLAQALDALGTN
jgi:invasion protein IalB